MLRDKFVGILCEDDDGYTFQYNDDYLLQNDAEPISLTLPLTSDVYRDKVLFPFFDGLLPEGWLLDIVTHNWKISPSVAISMLS